MDKTTENEEGKVSVLEAELLKSKTEAAAFQKELSEIKSASKKTDAKAFFGKLRDEGKVTPAVFEKAVELDTRLSEADKQEFRALFSALEPKVNLSGKHIADKKTAASDDSNKSLNAKIRAFQKEKKLVSFHEAAVALHAENPELFEEESE